MRHYLDLVRISAKQHKEQNRMTRLCIILAVFLVTVIFGMADNNKKRKESSVVGELQTKICRKACIDL